MNTTTNATSAAYRGRFAPSPTGPLHFGSLVAAVASYLQARTQNGEWWLRIEDIDPPREIAGAPDTIRRQLQAFGFEWDRFVFQSHNQDIFEDLLAQLRQRDALYPCACTRKDIIARTGSANDYPGTCRDGLPAGKQARSWRVRTHNRPLVFEDVIQGRIETNLAETGGDFVLKRAGGLYAYQLAVAADDALQQMTEVIRGSDLLDSTPRQLHVQAMLGFDSPRYGHLPVALDARGRKLSKQREAPPLDPAHPGPALWQALAFLGQHPPPAMVKASPATLWEWALQNWSLAAVPRLAGQCIEDLRSAADRSE